jgi:hypothetical protein
MTTTLSKTKTQVLPTLPAMQDKTLDIAQAREQSMAQMQTALNDAWAMLDLLPEAARPAAQTALMAAWDTATAMSGQWAETQELLLRSVALVEMQQVAIEELVKQRDGALNELSDLLNALEKADDDHPLVKTLAQGLYPRIYEQAMDDHNGAFWESLPYDIASTMGGQWTFMDAETLNQLISDPELDENLDGEGWTPEQVQWARETMLKVVHKMKAFQDQALEGDA